MADDKTPRWGVSSYDKRMSECGNSSESQYRHARCRCEQCVQAKNDNQLRRLQEQQVSHGTETAYRYGCRCVECSEQHNKSSIESESDHGTTTKARICSCDECKNTAAAYKKHLRKKRLADGQFSHGTVTGYGIGCRCKDCCFAKQQSRKRSDAEELS